MGQHGTLFFLGLFVWEGLPGRVGGDATARAHCTPRRDFQAEDGAREAGHVVARQGGWKRHGRVPASEAGAGGEDAGHGTLVAERQGEERQALCFKRCSACRHVFLLV